MSPLSHKPTEDDESIELTPEQRTLLKNIQEASGEDCTEVSISFTNTDAVLYLKELLTWEEESRKRKSDIRAKAA